MFKQACSRQRRLTLVAASVFLLLAGLRADAEDLSGTVRDDEDGEPLAGVSVVAVESESVAITDEDGRFIISGLPAGTYTILSVLEGYEELRMEVELPRPEALDLRLKPVVVDMEEIAIWAEREPPAATILSRQTLAEVAGGTDPLAAASQSPGLLGQDLLAGAVGTPDLAGGGVSDIPLPLVAVRGTNPLANVFYYDYIRAPTLLHAGGLPTPRSAVPGTLTEEAVVLKGGYGVEYGPGYGGIFMFRPLRGRPERTELTVHTGLLNVDAALRAPIGERVALMLSARKSLDELTWEPLFGLISGS